jgi:ParB/RepB/Spo0J family partition protein
VSATKAVAPKPSEPELRLETINIDRIRVEEGLGRQRDRQGHRELCRSIEQFGVLTPITVRPAPDASGDYLLIKGQGRTLACSLLGLKEIPALVVEQSVAETEKVAQFLVENVARLRLATVDRALLIARARKAGEETTDVARRFGVHPQTVRRLQTQLEGASHGEVAALRAGDLNLALHAVIARHMPPSDERAAVIGRISPHNLSAKDLDALLTALGWRQLVELGEVHEVGRLALLAWAAATMAGLPRGEPKGRIRQLAEVLPAELTTLVVREEAVV